MPQTQYDVVVIGAGHNSLIAAAYLARCGQKVLILEKNAFAGGGAVSREVTLPGFRHDTHATGIVLLQGSPIVTHDELQLMSRYGLEFINPPIADMVMFADGDTLVWYQDLEQACQEVAKYSRKDAETYRRTVEAVRSVMPVIGMTSARPPISLGSYISLLEKIPIGNELITAMTKSIYEVIMERFEHPKVQLALLKRSNVSCCGPEERGAGINILFMMAAIHSFPLSIVKGGTQNLTNATVRAIEAHGGEVRLNAAVKRVINAEGAARSVEMADGSVITARKAVIGSIHPHHLGEMVGGLDAGLVARAKATNNSYFATFALHVALDERIQWKFGGELPYQCTDVALVDSLDVDDFRRMCDAPRWGQVSERFASGVIVNTNHDPSRAPAGKHIISSFNFVSYNLKDGGAQRWDEIKDKYAKFILEGISRYAPNVSGDNILAYYAESPLDLERYSPSFTGGDTSGIGSYLHQNLGMRPTAELSQYRVPGAEGLYLAGPFMHPGVGISGGGRALAIRMMEDLKIDYGDVIRV